MAAPPGSLVLVGAVVGAHGVRGALKVRAFTAEPEGVAAYGPLYRQDGSHLVTPIRVQLLGGAVALRCAEIATREAAEALKGAALYAPRSAFPPAEEDEFYHVDLIGCAVEQPTGESLGLVTGVFDFGAGDVLEVRDGDATRYIEFTRETVPVVDTAARRLVAMLTDE